MKLVATVAPPRIVTGRLLLKAIVDTAFSSDPDALFNAAEARRLSKRFFNTGEYQKQSFNIVSASVSAVMTFSQPSVFCRSSIAPDETATNPGEVRKKLR